MGLASMDISYFVKPIEDNKAFRFGFNWDLGDLEVKGLKKKEMEALTSLIKMNLSFSLEGLSPEFIQGYFDLIRLTQSFNISKDRVLQQQIGMKGIALLGNFMQSKPVVYLSISPFENKMGKIEAEGKFQFIRMGPPVGKAIVKISNIDDIEKMLKAEKAIPDEKIEEIAQKLKGAFEIDKSGEGILTFEIKEEDTANFYLNGRPVSFRGMEH